MSALAVSIDSVWVLVCTVLVLLMQAGFTCLETGLVRAKNSINVALKNVADFCISSLLFWSAGFGLMFGASEAGLFGTSYFMLGNGGDGAGGGSGPPAWLMVFLFFQLAFCSTAATVVSGAVAERMRFRGYAMVTVLLSGLIYPVFGHWAWGGLVSGEASGWLERLGFIDFAGSTVVHSIGGWIALAAILVIGPRIGRFEKGGGAIEPSSMPMAALGMLLIWIGWFGFNGGSTLALNDLVPFVMVHTLLAAAAGGLAVMAISLIGRRGPDVGRSLNGVLAGLVAITASAHLVTVGAAVLIGAAGGLISYGASHVLARWRIDDAVGAVPVHLAAGIWGTLAVALLGDAGQFVDGASRIEQLGIQLVGVMAAGGLAFGVAYPVLRLVDRWLPLRVGAADERIGLNVSEHGASTALIDLLGHMNEQGRRGDFSSRVPVEPYTEAGDIAVQYNRVLEKFTEEVEAHEADARDLRTARDAAELANASKAQFLASVSHELRTPLNAIIGFSEIVNQEVHGPIDNEEYKEYVREIYQSGTHLLELVNDILDFSKIEADRMELNEEELTLGDVVASCERMLRQRAEKKRLQFDIDVPATLPPLVADKRAMRQIIVNLFSNAVKFTPEEGKVTLSAEIEADGRLALSVRDTGVGMAKEDIPRALEPFSQVSRDQTAYAAEGAGLGLSLTQALARLHGGTLVIEATPGVGTRVTVRMPRSRVGGRSAVAVAAS